MMLMKGGIINLGKYLFFTNNNNNNIPILQLQYLTLLCLHTITVLPLTTAYFVRKVHCTSNVHVLHSIKP